MRAVIVFGVPFLATVVMAVAVGLIVGNCVVMLGVR
jgi:hypothetical protein